MKTNNTLSVFLEQALKTPQAMSLSSEESCLTYSELLQMTASYSDFLDMQGFKKGDKVLILHPANTSLYVAILAILSKGGCIVFVESWKGIKDISNCYAATQCKYIIGNYKVKIAKTFFKNLRQAKVLSLNKKLFQRPAQFFLQEVLETDAALLSYSSGTSSTSKVVVRTHHLLRAQLLALKKHIQIDESTVLCTNFPVVVLLNLSLGINSFLSKHIRMSYLPDTDFEGLYKSIKTHGVSHLAFSPYLCRELARTVKNMNLPTLNLKQILLGGSPVYPQYIREISASLHTEKLNVVYGSSEAEPIAVTEAELILQHEKESGLYAGKLDSTVSCVLANPQNGEIMNATDSLVGEILVTGDHVVKNYLNSDEASKLNKLFWKDQIWHKTGDYGYFNALGELFLVGNPNYTAFALPLFEIEKRLSTIEGIAKATLINATVYAELHKGYNAESIKEKIKSMFPEIEACKFTSLPLDKRHHSKILYRLLK